MTTNDEEIKEKINDFIDIKLSHQGLIDFILAYGEKCREEERERIKRAFIERFKGAGELWFPYVSEGNCDEEEELEAAVNEWESIIDKL